MRQITLILFSILSFACGEANENIEIQQKDHTLTRTETKEIAPPPPSSPQTTLAKPKPPTLKTIHIFVALCDNKSQGIVPVPKQLGDGDDPRNNLYWGAMYDTKSFLKRSKAWQLIDTAAKTNNQAILERVIFKHGSSSTYLVADAYRGSQIKQAIQDFLNAAGGNHGQTLDLKAGKLGLSGYAQLVGYVGHNGLMDFSNASDPA